MTTLAFVVVLTSSPLTSKLATFKVKVCRREKSFQWYPDQSDRLTRHGHDICMKMLRSLRQKITAKFPVTKLSYSIVKLSAAKMLSQKVWTGSKLSRRSITSAKLSEKEKRKGKKVTKPQQVKGCRLLSHPVSKVWFLRTPKQKCL